MPGTTTNLLGHARAGERDKDRAWSDFFRRVEARIRAVAFRSGSRDADSLASSFWLEFSSRAAGFAPGQMDDGRQFFSYAQGAIRHLALNQRRAEAAQKRGPGRVAALDAHDPADWAIPARRAPARSWARRPTCPPSKRWGWRPASPRMSIRWGHCSTSA